MYTVYFKILAYVLWNGSLHLFASIAIVAKACDLVDYVSHNESYGPVNSKGEYFSRTFCLLSISALI